MIEAVFISDLHLNPDDPAITERYERFIRWAAIHTRCVYILGDFFHVWPGDDAFDAWSEGIVGRLAWLASLGVRLYFMHGNRDFLVGSRFAHLGSVHLLQEPTVISLGGTRVLLAHGDRYCTNDKGHQWLRRITRNRVFPPLFLQLPYRFRQKLVNQVRYRSQLNRNKPSSAMDIVFPTLLHHMQKIRVTKVIHGHIHKPGLTSHPLDGAIYQQYVLSDWDDNPLLMCYHNTNGFYFTLLPETENANRSNRSK